MFAQSIMKICGWSENNLLKLHNYQTENIIILSSTETCIAQWENTWEFVSKSLNKRPAVQSFVCRQLELSDSCKFF